MHRITYKNLIQESKKIINAMVRQVAMYLNCWRMLVGVGVCAVADLYFFAQSLNNFKLALPV